MFSAACELNIGGLSIACASNEAENTPHCKPTTLSPNKGEVATPPSGRAGSPPSHRAASHRISPGRRFKCMRTKSDPVAVSIASREHRRNLRLAVENNHLDSPAIWVKGEKSLAVGPLPRFIDACSLHDALHQMPPASCLATIKCVGAWRMGHVETHLLLEMLHSFCWQSPALHAALSPVAGHAAVTKNSGDEDCELLTDEDMAMLQSR